MTPAGLAPGEALFGDGESPAMTGSPLGPGRMRDIASVVLNDCSFVVSSMSLLDRHRRVFVPAIENLPDPAELARFDPQYHLDAGGGLILDNDFIRRAERIDAIAAPVCGGGFNDYRHFLCDGLPGILLHRQVFPDIDLTIVGPALAPWQEDILAALNLLDRYRPVSGPVVFAKVLTTTMLALHAAYPTGFVRPIFDVLRFRFGGSGCRPTRKVFLSRAGTDTHCPLRNRAEVEARLAAIGFDIIRPASLTLREQVRLMGEARVVVGESGPAMAGLGFCQPGTLVLEIQPDACVDGATRAMCCLFAHRWHLYLARVTPEDASFAIDCDRLSAAVATVALSPEGNEAS
ncbi:glycosyltransferase family 61 protein [Rhodovastum atsumiense]|uniref:Glycosyltransferase family 61 protein n=2 Tax=Rhodovastum atsumiense TaxID=504468 RepID=A0A5M6IYC6_9PROT|nr:glycosyltransferase 61 family protein [Rhodovastum atsumiense]KAA5613281.1 glycosyltransferase family 61 protein [Rhodovastum atsumiense]